MTQTVHSYIRRRGQTATEPVELSYLATGKHLQLDIERLTAAGLPRPDLIRGALRCASLADATRAVALGLAGLYTREVEVGDGDPFYAEHPEFTGPPRIQLRAPRPARP